MTHTDNQNDAVKLDKSGLPKRADWHARIERAKAVRDAAREFQKTSPSAAPSSKPRLWSN